MLVLVNPKCPIEGLGNPWWLLKKSHAYFNRIHPSRSNMHIKSIRDYVHHKVWQALV